MSAKRDRDSPRTGGPSLFLLKFRDVRGKDCFLLSPSDFYLTKSLLPSTRVETTEGSAKVEVSPKSWASVSPAEILRKIRRMILPLLVLGSPWANWMNSGVAMGPISLRTWVRRAPRNSSEGSHPDFRET